MARGLRFFYIKKILSPGSRKTLASFLPAGALFLERRTKMNTLKYKNMILNYEGFLGEKTVQDIISCIPEELIKTCTGKQLGLIMSALNKNYHRGKTEAGAEIIDGDGLWIDTIPEAGIMEINAIRSQLPELSKLGVAPQFGK
jgi:hypothetical protein